jgi:hypothetical protein
MAGLLWTLFVILVIIWAIGFFFAHLGSLIHIAIVLAVIVLVWNLISGSRRGGAY